MRVEFELSEHRVLVAAACGFVGLFALHAAFPGLFDYWPKTSSELADWVAAVGTVGAVIGAVLTTRYQINQARHVEHLKEVTRKHQNALGAQRIFQNIQLLIRNIDQAFKSKTGPAQLRTLFQSRLRHQRQTIDTMLSKEINIDIFFELNRARGAIEIALFCLDVIETDILHKNVIISGDMRNARKFMIWSRSNIKIVLADLENDLL